CDSWGLRWGVSPASLRAEQPCLPPVYGSLPKWKRSAELEIDGKFVCLPPVLPLSPYISERHIRGHSTPMIEYDCPLDGVEQVSPNFLIKAKSKRFTAEFP